jgi:SAM-dependent methyltransferase
VTAYAKLEGSGVTLQDQDIAYFTRGKSENQEFWLRLGGKPGFLGAVVVDLGCGHGSLCLDIAQSGAKMVIGIDLKAKLIAFANANLRQNYPSLAQRVEFRCENVGEMPERDIDCFVSKNTFEHVIELENVLTEMKTRLKPGGRIYAGFGPLWKSPFGDHFLSRAYIPWAHLWIPEKWFVTRLNRHRQQHLSSIYHNLNRLASTDYLRIFRDSGMDVVYLKINAGGHPLYRLSSALRRVPGLTEYLSFNVYCILEKRLE